MITGQTLSDVGQLLFGDFWRLPFERKFGISNRSLRRMLNNEQPIPAGLVADIETAVRDHAFRVDAMLDLLVDAQEMVS